MAGYIGYCTYIKGNRKITKKTHTLSNETIAMDWARIFVNNAENAGYKVLDQGIMVK